MRIGLMTGTDRERPRAERLGGLISDVVAAEEAGFASMWIPQVPGYLDAMTAVALAGHATQRIELGTAIVPIFSRHPVSMAQQALTTRMACGGRFALGIGPSHHWLVEDMFGLSYDKPASHVRDYLEVLVAGLAGAGAGTVDVENDRYRVHSPIDIADDGPATVLVAALAPMMLRIAGTSASGTILWMADERAVAEHVVPRITEAANEAGRPAPRIVAGVPVAVCRPADTAAARAYASSVLGHAEDSPNYVRLLEHGDAGDVGDTMAAGDEDAVLARLTSYRDAGVTDFAARILPLGSTPEERLASRRRTMEVLASVAPEL